MDNDVANLVVARLRALEHAVSCLLQDQPSSVERLELIRDGMLLDASAKTGVEKARQQLAVDCISRLLPQ